METPDADRVVLDTNVLLAATDEGRAEHESATAALNTWPAAGVVLYTSGQIMREYLAVATRPVAGNGLGLPQAAALANVRALRGRLELMAEERQVTERLIALLEEVACIGKQVHGANIVATMLVHGVDTVVTRNVDDFARFDGHIRAIELCE